MPKTRILLADDDHDHQTLLRQSLSGGRQDVEVLAVSSRDELLHAARTLHFDCIVMDFNLLPYTAPELLVDIQDLQDGVPRIVISSSESQHIVVESIRRGVADFVHKNDAIDGETLWGRVQSAIARARAKDKERRSVNRRLRLLTRRAQTDPLTGLLNRGGAEVALQPQSRRGDRRESAGVVFVDLDLFKRVNDQLGHRAGDEVLKQAARVIRSLARPNDLVTRWGGEEFVIIRQSDNLTDAWVWANRLRVQIAAQVILPGGIGPQTASVGVDVVPSGELSTDTVCRADHAMYLAKESGRNRVCTFAMVRAIDIAFDLGADPALSPRERLRQLVVRLRSVLGDTQLDHVGPHGARVCELATLVIDRLAGALPNREDLALAAEFHDIGKVGLPERLLALPRLLTEDERAFINEHARFGAELLRAVGAPAQAADAVLRHHERFDQQSNRATAPASNASILAACDAAVSMLSNRPYSRAKGPDQVLAELWSERGRQFHPDVVDAIHAVNSEALAAA
ncbi:MAG: diguanylate cyclase [Tepidisphaera sp.]|nr:diguanylate cyclase [Tepidisphaera sp.]